MFFPLTEITYRSSQELKIKWRRLKEHFFPPLLLRDSNSRHPVRGCRSLLLVFKSLFLASSTSVPTSRGGRRPEISSLSLSLSHETMGTMAARAARPLERRTKCHTLFLSPLTLACPPQIHLIRIWALSH